MIRLHDNLRCGRSLICGRCLSEKQLQDCEFGDLVPLTRIPTELEKAPNESG